MRYTLISAHIACYILLLEIMTFRYERPIIAAAYYG